MMCNDVMSANTQIIPTLSRNGYEDNTSLCLFPIQVMSIRVMNEIYDMYEYHRHLCGIFEVEICECEKNKYFT